MLVLMETGVTTINRRPEDSAAALAAIRGKIAFPASQPPVQSYEVASDGALWLQRENMGGPHRRWTVLDAADSPVGELELPRELRIAWTRGNTVWTVERDSLDVPWLVRYRIRRQ
jgi:hypothetical protein